MTETATWRSVTRVLRDCCRAMDRIGCRILPGRGEAPQPRRDRGRLAQHAASARQQDARHS
jgi:hypothetical protein